MRERSNGSRRRGADRDPPGKKISEYTTALKITGSNLKNIAYARPADVIAPDAQGKLKLSPDDADLHGDGIKSENAGGEPNLGFWDKPTDWASWKVKFVTPGTFKVATQCAAVSGGTDFVLEAAGRQLSAKAPQTSGWNKYQNVQLGRLEIKEAGTQEVKVRAKDAAHWKAINLRAIVLTPVK